MIIIHDIPLSEIQHGDHVYVRGGFRQKKQREGIVISGSDINRNEQWLVIGICLTKQNSNAGVRIFTLSEFVGSDSKLRRALYNQGDVLLHHFKLRGTSYIESRKSPDTIVNNALVIYKASRLLDTINKKRFEGANWRSI